MGQTGVILGFGQVHPNEFQQGGKTGKFLFARTFGEFYAVKTGLDLGAVLFMSQIIAAYANDAAPGGK